MTVDKRYDELEVGDVVLFHGANVKIINIRRHPYTDKLYADQCDMVISFEIRPADDEAVEILGNFYSHGWYGGVGCLKMPYYPDKQTGGKGLKATYYKSVSYERKLALEAWARHLEAEELTLNDDGTVTLESKDGYICENYTPTNEELGA